MVVKGSGSIGGLVFLIAIFIIIYVLIMPPCEKCQLLNQGDCSDVCDNLEIEGVLLFDEVENMGSTNQIIHDLDPLSLYLRMEDEIEIIADSLLVNRGLFGNIDQDLNFNIEDLQNIENVYFSFRVLDSRGTLFVELNDKIVFSEKVESPVVKKISLPTSYLKEKNSLKIYVDSPGLNFWTKNHYTLKNLEIQQEFEKIHHEESISFYIGQNEKNNLDSSRLDYSIFCNQANGLTIMKIYLNEKLISSELVECKSAQKSILLDQRDLIIGENDIKFVVDNGDFLLSPIKIINQLDKEINPSYYFQIDSSIFDFAEEYYISLFFDNEDTKEIKIILNNYDFILKEDSKYFEKDISQFVKKGNNFLELISENYIDSMEFKIWYE